MFSFVIVGCDNRLGDVKLLSSESQTARMCFGAAQPMPAWEPPSHFPLSWFLQRTSSSPPNCMPFSFSSMNMQGKPFS